MKIPFLIFTAVFGISYFIIEKAGLFATTTGSALHILYSWPILIDSLLVLCIVSWAALRKRGKLALCHWIGVLSVILIVSGLWSGSLTRFSAEAVLTEGQSFYSGHGSFLPETVYMGRYASPPDFGMKLEKISAKFSDSGKEVTDIKATTLFLQNETGEMKEYIITSGLPGFISGSLFSVKDLGYSPRYELKSKEGMVLDSSFVYMRLFPPGSEDFFRLLSPLSYHVRYFPDGKDDIREKLFRLRIVRNKDIVLNREVKLSEEAEFENSMISFEEVRMWTRLCVVKDRGQFIAFAGLFLGAVYLLMIWKQPCNKQRPY